MKNDCQLDLMKISYVDLNMLNTSYDFQLSRIMNNNNNNKTTCNNYIHKHISKSEVINLELTFDEVKNVSHKEFGKQTKS
jgi:hypothetical protein